MTDQQFQPWQPTPPVQWGGVFWGTFVEDEHHEDVMFGPLQELEKKQEQEQAAVSPFWAFQETEPVVSQSTNIDGYSMPQYTATPAAQEPTPTEESPSDFQISWEPSTPVVEEETPVVEQEVEQTPVEEVPVEPAPVESANEPQEDIAEPQVTPVVEDEEVNEEIVKEDDIEDEEAPVLSDIQEKFTSLLENISLLHNMLSLDNWETLEIVWANNDDFSILYHFSLNDQNEIRVKRIETQKQSNETSFNELKLWINPESALFELFLDDVLLYEESELLEDPKKKSQVMEKINKLIFLSESRIKDIQKEMRVKQQEEEERRRLNDIFRNF